MLFIAGMWFQDLWTYDFRRTEMCIIPYATQMGEISFCAYNTGVGWRYIVEQMNQTAHRGRVVQEHGKHAVYASPRRPVPLPPPRSRSPLTIPKDGLLVPVGLKTASAVGSGRESRFTDQRPGHKRLAHLMPPSQPEK